MIYKPLLHFHTNNFFKIPQSYASCAVSFLAVKMSSFAFISPINRGKRCVPPAPGIIAQLVSVNRLLLLEPQSQSHKPRLIQIRLQMHNH